MNSSWTGQRLNKLVIAFLSSFDHFFYCSWENKLKAKISVCRRVDDQYLCIPNSDFIFGSFILLGWSVRLKFHVNASVFQNRIWRFWMCLQAWHLSQLCANLQLNSCSFEVQSCHKNHCIKREYWLRQWTPTSITLYEKHTTSTNLHLTKANTHIQFTSRSKCLIWKSYRNDR